MYKYSILDSSNSITLRIAFFSFSHACTMKGGLAASAVLNVIAEEPDLKVSLLVFNLCHYSKKQYPADHYF